MDSSEKVSKKVSTQKKVFINFNMRRSSFPHGLIPQTIVKWSLKK